eukprot:PLAT1030.1.p1 GENE.PLAT1030.1~~PLAT1030.1.p1  ORF type:complete len:336 (+),score=93.49 PLAT1030.1:27-1010(+)
MDSSTSAGEPLPPPEHAPLKFSVSAMAAVPIAGAEDGLADAPPAPTLRATVSEASRSSPEGRGGRRRSLITPAGMASLSATSGRRRSLVGPAEHALLSEAAIAAAGGAVSEEGVEVAVGEGGEGGRPVLDENNAAHYNIAEFQSTVLGSDDRTRSLYPHSEMEKMMCLMLRRHATEMTAPCRVVGCTRYVSLTAWAEQLCTRHALFLPSDAVLRPLVDESVEDMLAAADGVDDTELEGYAGDELFAMHGIAGALAAGVVSADSHEDGGQLEEKSEEDVAIVYEEPQQDSMTDAHDYPAATTAAAAAGVAAAASGAAAGGSEGEMMMS